MVRAVFAQRLVPRVGGGRVAAYEILLGTPAVRNLINERRFDRLQACLETGRQIGMQTFAQHQSRLVVAGTVSADDARLDEL
jgi:twitching motility protein PilT